MSSTSPGTASLGTASPGTASPGTASPGTAPAPSVVTPSALTLSWVLRLRWWAALGQGITIVVAVFGLDLALPTAALAALVFALAVSNGALELWRRRGGAPDARGLALVFTLDIAVLTGLLALSGGPSNPFSIFYLVQITIAAVVLGVGYAVFFVSLSAVAYAALFVFHVPVAGMEHAHRAGHDHAAHNGQAAFSTHLYGMWVAFTLAAALIAYFVARLAAGLRAREQELALAQRTALRNERLASLSTLAAGAAHELGTPLGTIAIAARELERALASAADPSLAEDARLIRHEVDRCREVITRLGSQAGQSPGEAPEEVAVGELVEHVRERVGPRAEGRVIVSMADADARAVTPVRGLVTVLVNLVQNGLDALGERRDPVRLSVQADAHALTFSVADEGAGMSEDVLARVGEPFFTTKGPAAGMGLGVFLARRFAEGVGGALDITSTPGRGTTVTLRMPRFLTTGRRP